MHSSVDRKNISNAKRISVIDDGHDFADILGLTLNNNGFTNHVVYSGKEKVHEIKNKHLELAIIDFRLG